ncbi:hypothetical protein ACQP1U_08985 [Actinomycetota bacterium]
MSLRQRLRRRVGTGRVLAIVLAGVLVTNLVAAVAAFALLPRGDAPARKATPPSTAAKAAPAKAHVLPADKVISTVMRVAPATLYGKGWGAGAPVDKVAGPSFTGGCLTAFPEGASPLIGSQRRASGAGTSALTQLWAYSAGQGASALEALRTKLTGCAGMADSPVSGARGFTAVIPVGGQRVAWAVWQRGDVIGSIAGTKGSVDPTAEVGAAATAMDAQLTTRLDPVCSREDSTPEDVRRNPAVAGKQYQPYLRQVTITPPTLLPLPEPSGAPAIGVSLPGPRPYPELAAPILPERSEWLDTNNDGTADTPPPMASAAQTEVPSLVDPASVNIPSGLVTSDPVEPERPQEPAVGTLSLPAVDRTGPGCGWAFAGTTPPSVNEASVNAAVPAAMRKGLAEQTRAVAEYRVAMTNWRSAHAAWAKAQASYDAYAQYATARDNAERALADARAQKSAAVGAYQKAIADAKAALAREAAAKKAADDAAKKAAEDAAKKAADDAKKTTPTTDPTTPTPTSTSPTSTRTSPTSEPTTRSSSSAATTSKKKPKATPPGRTRGGGN